jgi:hypothetical protein
VDEPHDRSARVSHSLPDRRGSDVLRAPGTEAQ